MDLLILGGGTLVAFVICYGIVFGSVKATFVRFLLSLALTALAVWGTLLYLGKDMNDVRMMLHLEPREEGMTMGTLHTLKSSAPSPTEQQPPAEKREMKLITIGE